MMRFAELIKAHQKLLGWVAFGLLIAAAIGLLGYIFFVQSPSANSPLGNRPTGQGSSQSSGPYYDQTYYSISTDPKQFPAGNKIADHASVPDVVQLSRDVGSFKKGSFLVYFVDFSQTGKSDVPSTISVISGSPDARTWGTRTPIKLANQVNLGVDVDPAIVQLQDGRLRLYFFGADITNGDPAQQTTPHRIYSAISSDGINFAVETGVRVEDTHLTDPDVVYFQNQWYLYYSGIGVQLEVSPDGLNFTKETLSSGANDTGGIPGVVALDNGIRLYGCVRNQGIVTAFANDGRNFTKDGENVVPGGICDPSPIRLADGRYMLVYKVVQLPSR